MATPLAIVQPSTDHASIPQVEDRSSVTQKMFAVLEAVASSVRPLTVSDLTALLDVPKGTMHRIVRQLDDDGLLIPEPGSRGYVPAPRLLSFAMNVVHAGMRSAPTHAIIERLSAEMGETCNVGMISGSALIYVDRVEAAWPFGLHYETGSRVPLYCTSMGKLLLAHLPKRRRDHLLSVLPLHRYTENTLTDAARLEEAFTEIRALGYSLDNQEFLAGVICIAVPVRDAGGNVRAAIAVSAPQARMSVSLAVERVELLSEAARQISASWDTNQQHDDGEE